MEKNLSREGECARNRVGPGGSPCGACKDCCDEALARVTELEAHADRIAQERDLIDSHRKRGEARVVELRQQIATPMLAKAMNERDAAQDRVAELVESEEKAWQTVSKLRVELETVDRLRRQVAKLEAEVQKEKDNAGAGESERFRLRKYNAEYRDRVAELESALKLACPICGESAAEWLLKAWAVLQKPRPMADAPRGDDQCVTIFIGDRINTVNIAGDPNLPKLIAAAWPSHVVGRPVLERAVEMIEGHPRLDRKVFELEAELSTAKTMGEQQLQFTHARARERDEAEVRVSELEARPKCRHDGWSATCPKCVVGRVHGWATADMWRKGASGPGTTKLDMRFQAHTIAAACTQVMGWCELPAFEGFDQGGEGDEQP